jgi:hypothetical protein
MLAITYTGKTLAIGYTDSVGHQYALLLNLKDGSSVVKEDYGAVRYVITHHANGQIEQKAEVGYGDGG